MSDKVRKSIVFGILFVVAIWGYSNISERIKKNKDTSTDTAAQQADPASTNDPASYGQAAVTFNTAAPEGIFDEYIELKIETNPFYHNRAFVSAGQEIELHLLGILYRTANAQALINGQVVKIGDTIDGYEITDITSEFVALQKGGREITLRPKKETS